MDLKSVKVEEEVASKVESKVGAIVNGGESTKQAKSMSKEGY